MILEVAILKIKPEETSKFEAVFPKAESRHSPPMYHLLTGSVVCRNYRQ